MYHFPLQMYRTVKTTDRAAASSGNQCTSSIYIYVNIWKKVDFFFLYILMRFCDLGQSDVYENGSSGDTSEEMLFDVQNSRKSELSTVQQQGRQNLPQDKEYHALWSNSSRLVCYKLIYYLSTNYFCAFLFWGLLDMFS